MQIEKLRELKAGEEVTVITTGAFQLVDVAAGIKFPPLTEVKTPLTPFVENQLRLKNLTLAGEDDAPKAEGDSKSADELAYLPEDQRTASRSKPTEDGKTADLRKATGGDRDEISQGAQRGKRGTSQAEKSETQE